MKLEGAGSSSFAFTWRPWFSLWMARTRTCSAFPVRHTCAMSPISCQFLPGNQRSYLSCWLLPGRFARFSAHLADIKGGCFFTCKLCPIWILNTQNRKPVSAGHECFYVRTHRCVPLPDKPTPLQALKSRPDNAYDDAAGFPSWSRAHSWLCHNTEAGVSAPCQSFGRSRTATPR